MRQLGGKALRVRLAHTGHQRGAAAGVQEEQAGARHALQRRLHDVAARKEPQRDAPRYGKQQAAPKRDSFTLEPPSFMRQQSEPAKPASNGAFAFPAFRLTPDDKDQK